VSKEWRASTFERVWSRECFIEVYILIINVKSLSYKPESLACTPIGVKHVQGHGTHVSCVHNPAHKCRITIDFFFFQTQQRRSAKSHRRNLRQSSIQKPGFAPGNIHFFSTDKLFTVLFSFPVSAGARFETLNRGAQKLMGENLKLVWAEFSTLSWAVLKMCTKLMYVDARTRLWLKTRARFCPVC
jgi:hypothetical protein